MSYRNPFFVVIAFLTTSGVLFAADWQTDYAKALETAKSENKRVLLHFLQSDYCGPCRKLKRQVFSHPEFTSYAEKHLLLVEVDCPIREKLAPELAKQNEQLAKQYDMKARSTPLLILLDPAGKVIRESTWGVSNDDTPADMIAWIEGKSNR